MRIHKYQALGNDYVVLEGWPIDGLSPQIISFICERHRGVGADGVLVEGSRENGGAPSLRIFNPDGSEAEKSGNGLRIFVQYLWEQSRVNHQAFRVFTRGGEVRCEVRVPERMIAIAMGMATFRSEMIPVRGAPREVVDEVLEVAGEKVAITAVSIGNPHCVVPVKATSSALARRLGPALEIHPLFPNRTNVQFVEVLATDRIRLEIWERGAGYTLASGSSSCAAVAACFRLGLCGRRVVVEMPGGQLQIELGDDDCITMTGPARKVFEGTLAPEFLHELL